MFDQNWSTADGAIGVLQKKQINAGLPGATPFRGLSGWALSCYFVRARPNQM